jgi:glycosyltransferase involved in cell wall biosynthesis
VILEAASAGIPSIVYNTYGASDWMKHYENGFVVNDIAEVRQVINKLLERPEILKEISENAVKLAEKFDWKLVIKSWEKEIEDLFRGR